MTAAIQGVYFDGATSEKSDVSLFCRGDGLVCIQGLNKEPVSIRMLTVSPRIGNTPRYIEFPDGGQFETLDNDAVDRLCERAAYRDRQGFIHKLESHKRAVLATVVIVVLSAWGFVQYGIPAMSRELAVLLPDESSRKLGEGLLQTLDEYWLKPSKLSEIRQTTLSDMFNGLSRELGESLPLSIEFRQGGPLEANAFALPDGTIVFTDELIALANDDREVAAVMLHEIGHVHHRHSLRAAIEQFGLAMVVMAVTGDVSASSSVVTALPVLLVRSGYSRSMEWEADGFALIHMRHHGIAPEFFAAMMEKLEARHSAVYRACTESATPAKQCLRQALEVVREGGASEGLVEGYLSTHPLSQERAERFRKEERGR
ncbi:MAG: M48 family metallopeptidase [Gammaproteobacteria bacterium]|nr:M48 family metallopeptidase [Gammaproteobacteria bacterium]